MNVLKAGPRLILLPTVEVESLAESLVALANANGGLIVLGVDDEGNLADEIWEEEAADALYEATRYCHPPVSSQWRSVVIQEQTLIGIDVPRSLDLHTLADGRVLVRSGDQNRVTLGNELQKVSAGKTATEYEVEVVAGATVDDFDHKIVQEYLSKRELRGTPKLTDLEQLFFEIGATDHEGRPTVAGILLFGKNPQAFLPQSGVVFVKFAGKDPRNLEGGGSYGRRDEIKGPLARVVERTWNIIWEEMRVGAVISGLEREDKPEYPPFAVREALINAVCHRDYRLSGRRVEVRMYADRMEVISPGGLPGYMTLDNLVDEHYSRNPRMVNGLFQWGYIEELGLGIDQMIEDMVQAGHPPPTFQATPHLFKVLLHHKGEEEEEEMPAVQTQTMNQRQMLALQYIREHGSLSNRDYQKLCPRVSPETLRLDLVDLIERGLLLKIGSKRGTHYILK